MPGFLTSGIIDGMCPPKKESDFNKALKYLCYSIFALAIFSWAYILAFKHLDFTYAFSWFVTILISLVSAVILGFTIGIAKQKRLVCYIARLFKVPLSHPIPTAWDYTFSTCSASWLIITLINGQQLAGKYDSNSFSSSDPDERDILVEELYTVKNGQWSKVEGNKGIYIAKNRISHIEFIESEDA